jgi:hypothetical protein
MKSGINYRMKVIEVTPAVPDVLRLFLEVKNPRGDFLASAISALSREKTNHYATVNKFLDGEVSQAAHLLEELSQFQFKLEEERALTPKVEDRYHDLKERVQNQVVELHRAKVKLTDFKIALCRFIVAVEAPKKDLSALRSLEEWTDVGTLAEMRLSRALEVNPDPTKQQFLSLFTTFRSIVCSYDGPSQYLRQVDAAWASLEALHEKVRLEVEVVQAAESLEETRKELSTVKLNLTSLQTRLQRQQAEQIGDLQVKKTHWLLKAAAMMVLAGAGAGAYFYLKADAANMQRKVGGVITQPSCRDIADQLAQSPRYQSQVLIFRKFGRDIYFKANAAICEKLHRLDSMQVGSLALLLRLDFETGKREIAAFNGHRVLQTKGVGQDKLVVQLMNPTANDVEFKVRVLELATTLKAILQADPAGDALIVDLPVVKVSDS